MVFAPVYRKSSERRRQPHSKSCNGQDGNFPSQDNLPYRALAHHIFTRSLSEELTHDTATMSHIHNALEGSISDDELTHDETCFAEFAYEYSAFTMRQTMLNDEPGYTIDCPSKRSNLTKADLRSAGIEPYQYEYWASGHAGSLPRSVAEECCKLHQLDVLGKIVRIGATPRFFVDHEKFLQIQEWLKPDYVTGEYVWDFEPAASFDESFRVIYGIWTGSQMKIAQMLPDPIAAVEEPEGAFQMIVADRVMKQHIHTDSMEEDPFKSVGAYECFARVYPCVAAPDREFVPPKRVETLKGRAHAVLALELIERYIGRGSQMSPHMWRELVREGWLGSFDTHEEAVDAYNVAFYSFHDRLVMHADALRAEISRYDDAGWTLPGVEPQGFADVLKTTAKKVGGVLAPLIKQLRNLMAENPFFYFLAIVLLLTYFINLMLKIFHNVNPMLVKGACIGAFVYVMGKHGVKGDGEWFKRALTDFEAYEDPNGNWYKVEPQSAHATMATALIGFLIARRVPMYARIINHKKFEDGVSAMFNGGAGMLEAAINAIFGLFGKKEISLFHTHDKIVTDWRDAAQQFSHKVVLAKLDAALPETAVAFERLRDQGLVLMSDHKNSDNSRIVKSGMDSLMRASPFFPATGSCKGRMEPVCMCLLGEPGIGKTFLARLIAQMFASKVSTEEEKMAMGGDLARMVFQKDSSTYWESYIGQLVCVMDDFLQTLPMPGPDSEVANFIRMVNQWPYPLNMATLDMKGKFYFKSRFILATSNINNLSSLEKVITSQEAVSRRIGHCYKLFLKPGLSKSGRLDVDVMRLISESAEGIKGLDAVWEFKKHDLMNSRTNEEVSYTFSEVFAEILSDYDKRIRIETSNEQLISKLIHFETRRPVDNEAPAPLEPTAPPCAAFGSEISVEPQGFVKNAAVLCAAAVAVKVIAGKAKRALCSAAMTVIRKPAVKAALCVTAVALVPAVVLAAIRTVRAVLKQLLSPLGLWPKKKVEAQGANVSMPDEIAQRVSKNCVHVYNDSQRVGGGLMITSDMLLVPAHYALMHKGHDFDLCDVGGVPIGSIKELVKDFRSEGKDMCIYRTKRQVDGCADIRRHFWGVGTKYADNKALMIGRNSCVRTDIAKGTCVRSYNRVPLQSVLIRHGYRTSIGDCGNAIVSADKCSRQRVMGIHVAGEPGAGFFVPVSREVLEAVEAQAHCGFEEIARVDPLFNSGDTAFVPTAFAGYFQEPDGAPAALRPRKNKDGVRIDPMIKAVEATHRDFDSIKLPDMYDSAVDVVVGEIFGGFDGADLSQLTYEQAVEGIAGDAYINGIARGKSMGYPLCRKYHNKRAAFGAEGPYVFDTPAAMEVRREHDALIEAYESGQRGVAVFRDVLKDEIRPFKKIDAVDTRLISASPVQYTILTRRVYGRFCAEFMRTRLKHGGLVGVNPMSHEWTYIYNALNSMNDDGLGAAGDYKQFDKSQHPSILLSIMRHITRRLPKGEVSADCCSGVSEDMARSVHIGGDSYSSNVIYQTNGALPSGHPMTSVINSIYNMVVFRLCWAMSGHGRNLWNFRENVLLYVYGDDNIFAPSNEHKGFNMRSMADFAPTVGMVYTSENKDGEVYDLKPIGACGFLKRGFAPEQDYVYAPLELPSIYDMFNWRRSNMPDDAHLSAVSLACLMEASAHRFDIFLSVLEKLRSLLREREVMDPTFGVIPELAYSQQRTIYRKYVPVWSFEE